VLLQTNRVGALKARFSFFASGQWEGGLHPSSSGYTLVATDCIVITDCSKYFIAERAQHLFARICKHKITRREGAK